MAEWKPIVVQLTHMSKLFGHRSVVIELYCKHVDLKAKHD